MEKLDEARRAVLKAYCKLDEQLTPGEEQLLERFYRGACYYLGKGGVSAPPADTERRAAYDNLVDAIVLENWDKRGTTTAFVVPDNPVFRRQLNQLKLPQPTGVSESDTEAGGNHG